MPDVVGRFRSNDMSKRAFFIPRIWDSLLFEDSPNSRRPQMQARPAEGVGDSDLSHGGAKAFESLNKISDKIRIPVDWLGKLKQCVQSVFFKPSGPRGDGHRRDPEGVRGLPQRPAPGSTHLENGHSLMWAIAGPAMGNDVIHPGVFDADLISKKCAFLSQALILRCQSHATADVARSHTSGMDDGEMGK